MRGQALTLLACAFALAASPLRSATTATGIEIDGDYTDDPVPSPEDWYPGFPPASDPVGSDDETLCGTSPAPKNDIANYFLANTDEHLYVGMERLTNNGNTSFFLSFDITGDGPSRGDFIFVFCFGSGAVVTDAYVLEWDEAAGTWVQDATPPEVLFAVNATRIAAPFGTLDEHGRPATVIDPGRFAESRITLADIEGFDICDASAVTGVLESKSSCSLSSECKDTTGPFTFSFDPLTVGLSARQSAGCEQRIVAVATPSPAGATVTYQWFVDGEDVTDRDPTWATSPSIEIALDGECGPVEVRVIADDGTCAAEAAATVDVNARPVAAITSLSVGGCDQTLTFDGRASTDCNGADLVYGWDFETDGTVDSNEPSGTWTFADCGDRLVSLVVSDGTCASEPVFQQIRVNEAPVAALEVVPTGCLGVAWRSLSTDCDVTRPSSTGPEDLTLSFDPGDGSPPESAPSGTHDYADCGTRVLTLTVTDASGCTDVATRTLTLEGLLDLR